MKALSCGALAVMSVVLLGDVSTLVAAAATRAAVDWRAAAAAVNWLGDGGWSPSIRSFFLVLAIVERCCWWKCFAEMFGSACR